MVPTGAPSSSMPAALRLMHEGRLSEAIAAFRALLLVQPGLADGWYNLGYCLRLDRQPEAALQAYQRALDLGIARPDEIHLNRSVLYADFLHRPADAERELKQALQSNPNSMGALYNLGNLCEDFGRRAEAQQCYARILQIDSKQFTALARLANAQAPDSDLAPFIVRLRDALSSASEVSAAERADMGFALGRLLDMDGNYEGAFAAYADANRASGSHPGENAAAYDPRAQERLVDRLIAASAQASGRSGISSPAYPEPLFVCGMFRSGSTLAEQLLTASTEVVAGGELDFWPSLAMRDLDPFPESMRGLDGAQILKIAAAYRAELKRIAPRAAFVTDKRPDNFLYLGLIKQIFPASKIIHTVRDALDNCLSIFFLHLDGRMSYARNLEHIAHYYRQYGRLMAHWKSLYGDDILDFSYDALVANPEAELSRLFDFAGVAWDGKVPAVPSAGPIRTASVWQVRENLYTHSSGRSRHYASYLSGLRAALSQP